jgi:hypothetical protein
MVHCAAPFADDDLIAACDAAVAVRTDSPNLPVVCGARRWMESGQARRPSVCRARPYEFSATRNAAIKIEYNAERKIEENAITV